MRNLYDSVDIPKRFKQYWKMVERGRCSYKDLNQKYPKLLDTSDIKQHNFDSTEYERRIRVLVSAAKRQSDRSMVKCSSFRNGVTQLSRLSGQEYPGLLLLTFVALDGLMSSKIEERNFRLLLNKSLVLYQSLMVHQLTETDVVSLESTIKEYLAMFKKIGKLNKLHI